MKKQKLLRISSVVLVLTILLSISAQAITTLSVPFYKQEKTQWCWAAAAQMVGHYTYPSSTKTQGQIVTYVKGSTVNKPANTSETWQATKYAADNRVNFTWYDSPSSFYDTSGDIDWDRPLIALVNDGNTGHYYVIYGYNVSGSTEYLYLIDPWDGRGKYTSYSNFRNGTWTETRPWITTIS